MYIGVYLSHLLSKLQFLDLRKLSKHAAQKLGISRTTLWRRMKLINH
ncbi:hypothetical protein ECE15_18405 [Acinetobacter baumannii]|nr:hypothetical protein [Acinetobacter baumannii]